LSEKTVYLFNGFEGQPAQRITIQIADILIGEVELTPKAGEWISQIKF
jgi:hypothetical protein